jgi:hypothetical protein
MTQETTTYNKTEWKETREGYVFDQMDRIKEVYGIQPDSILWKVCEKGVTRQLDEYFSTDEKKKKALEMAQFPPLLTLFEKKRTNKELLVAQILEIMPTFPLSKESLHEMNVKQLAEIISNLQ